MKQEDAFDIFWHTAWATAYSVIDASEVPTTWAYGIRRPLELSCFICWIMFVSVPHLTSHMNGLQMDHGENGSGKILPALAMQMPKMLGYHSHQPPCQVLFLHEKRVAHRDIKPENVLKSSSGCSDGAVQADPETRAWVVSHGGVGHCASGFGLNRCPQNQF